MDWSFVESAWFAGILGGVIGSTAGSLVGYFLAHSRDARLRTNEILAEVLSEEFTERRKKIRDLCRLTNTEISQRADHRNGTHDEDRLNVFTVFNRYSIFCDQWLSRDIDRKIFDNRVAQMIRDDYNRIDSFFGYIAAHQAADKDIPKDEKLVRPFYSNIRLVVIEQA